MSLFQGIVESTTIDEFDSKYLKCCPKSQALIIIHEEIPLILQHIGSDLDYLDDIGMLSEYFESECEAITSGVYIWEGGLHVDKSYYGYYGDFEQDEWLEGKLRQATKEEWQAHLNDEWVWDLKLWYTPEALKEQGWPEE
jgi:hypothetical protein